MASSNPAAPPGAPFAPAPFQPAVPHGHALPSAANGHPSPQSGQPGTASPTSLKRPSVENVLQTGANPTTSGAGGTDANSNTNTVFGGGGTSVGHQPGSGGMVGGAAGGGTGGVVNQQQAVGGLQSSQGLDSTKRRRGAIMPGDAAHIAGVNLTLMNANLLGSGNPSEDANPSESDEDEEDD